MRKPVSKLLIVVLLLSAGAIMGTGCSKKVTPPPAVTAPPPPPPAPVVPPAPTMTLSTSPSTIEKGQSALLSWSSTNASRVSIDGGIGTVEPSGSRRVNPSASTTYRATASGPGGNATAETRLTVTEPPAPVTPPPVRPLTDNEFFTTNVKDIYFDYDKYEIREDARVTLLSDARALAERGAIHFTIEGHCDERGSEKYNLALGDRRANAAKQFLLTQGVSTERVDTISYGKERPMCTEQNEDCWQKNRRAHFVLR